jgi:hypothetical protein
MSALIGANLSGTSTAASHGLGDRHRDHAGNDWVYVQASAACAIYDVVTIKNGFETTPLTAATAKTPMEVGFAQYAFGADEFGWVMTNGRPTINVLVDAGANVPLYTSGTAGKLDDATTTQMVAGIVLTDTMTATTSGPMAAVATFPRVGWGQKLSQN